MCGHVGIFGKNLNLNCRNFFEQGLFVDALRGVHGTGVCSVHSNRKKTTVFKRAMIAHDFMSLKSFDSLFVGGAINYSAFMGHNRHATKGAINHANSHPFEYDHITLMHNGSLNSQMLLPDYRDFDVDSENIAYAVAKDGIEATTPKLNGSYSLVWHDAETESINFVRNDQRPMFIAKVKKVDNFIYGSEPGMLRWLAKRNNMDLEYIIETLVGKWYSYNLDTMELTTTDVEEHSFQSQNNAVVPFKRQGFAKEHVEALGLKMDQRVNATVFSYTPYRNHVTGVISGFMDDDPWNEVIMYGVPEPKGGNGSAFSACIVGFNKYPTGDDGGILILKGDTFQAVLEGEIEDNVEDFTSKRNKRLKKKDDFKVTPVEAKMFTKQELEEEGQFAYYEVKKFQGPYRALVTGEKFDELTTKGCAHCGARLYLQDHDEIGWRDNDPICTECIEELAEFADLKRDTVH